MKLTKLNVSDKRLNDNRSKDYVGQCICLSNINKTNMGYLLTVVFLLTLSCRQEPNTEVMEKSDGKEKILTVEEVTGAIVNEEKIEINSIGILVYNGFFDLDAFGPYAVLSNMVGTDVFFVAEKKGKITTSSGIEISVTKSIEEVNKLDILLIPGGTVGTVRASKNQNLIDWIKKIHGTTTYTTSVCTGAWILGEAGLLKNKKATTNWYRAKEKIESYQAEFVQERYVQDGKLWTSAGVSAGIDMSLALVNEIKGETYTKLIMLNLEYDPKPPLKGGSVEKTNEGLVEYMSGMYDQVLETNK